MPEEPKSRADWAEEYEYSLSFLKSEPDIWKAFNQAVKQGWTAEKFEAELRETKWFRQHSDVYRSNWEQKHSPDKGTWQTRLGKSKATIEDYAAQMGAQLSEKQLNRIAHDSLLFGWSNAQINNKLANYVDVVKSTTRFGGESGTTQDELHKIAMDYGIKVSDKTIGKWVVNIARGDTTLNDFKARIMDQSATLYPAYSEQIRKGATMRQVAEPYLQQMAQTLELNPENIDLYDKHIQTALRHPTADKNEKGGSPEYNMYDFESQLRKDERWTRTKNAQDQAMAITRQVMTDWGFGG